MKTDPKERTSGVNRNHRMLSSWMTGTVVFGLLLFAQAGLPLAGLAAASLKDKIYDRYGVYITGFMEFRHGMRLQSDPHEKSRSISEARLQLDSELDTGWAIMKFKGDFVEDFVDLSMRGEPRALNIIFSPLDRLDVKLGRQTLTWGTGDLLFINDLFPKDWESFFIGRDDEYLKAPSDALKLAYFTDYFNFDMVYTPEFDPSVYIDGRRLSYWNPQLQDIAGRNATLSAHDRNRFFSDAEYAFRLSKNISGIEWALYGYSGFWKTPEGFDPDTQKLTYPKLSVYGASLRSPIFGGIGNLEVGYYDSRDDRDGEDPFVRNSEWRFLAGFERELAKELIGGFQYYLEWMQDHDEYEGGAGDPPKKDEYRHVFTVRLTKLLMNQNLRLSLFSYYSPSDQDGYLRPKANYKITDAWAVEVGGNIFFGSDDHTFFGQFQDNTNAYGSVRVSF